MAFYGDVWRTSADNQIWRCQRKSQNWPTCDKRTLINSNSLTRICHSWAFVMLNRQKNSTFTIKNTICKWVIEILTANCFQALIFTRNIYAKKFTILSTPTSNIESIREKLQIQGNSEQGFWSKLKGITLFDVRINIEWICHCRSSEAEWVCQVKGDQIIRRPIRENQEIWMKLLILHCETCCCKEASVMSSGSIHWSSSQSPTIDKKKAKETGRVLILKASEKERNWLFEWIMSVERE